MRCSYCGRENENDKIFCSGCGTKLTYYVQSNQSSIKSIMLVIFIAVICVMGIILAVSYLGKSGEKQETFQEQVAETTDNNEVKRDEEKSIYTIVDEPVYKVYINKEYSLQMPYPSHFVLKEADDMNTLFSAEDPNGAAKISLLAFRDMQGVMVNDVLTIMENSINESGGTIKDRQMTQNGFYLKAKYDNAVVCTQGYLIDGRLCCLEFSYAEFESHVYEKYFSYMADNLIVGQIITEDRSNSGETMENIN